MKKKVLLLITTSLTFSAAIAAISLSSTNSNLERVGGVNDPTPFTIDFSTVSSVDDDTHQVLLKSARGATVRVVVEGAYYQTNSFKAKGRGEDFYVYNLDPIRGINSASVIYFDDFGESITTFMASYNPIDINDVLDGKYQDLCFRGNSNHQLGARSLSINATQAPSLVGSRYFVFNFFPEYDENLFLSQLTTESVCFEEPTEVEIGTNSGALSEEEIAEMKVITANSLELSDLGNGAFFVDSRNFLYQLHKKGVEAPICSRILDNDFEVTLSVPTGKAYQKVVSDKVHTIISTKLSFTHFDVSYFFYSNEYDYFASSAEWPSDYVENHLSDLHKNIIPELDSDIIEENIAAFTTQYYEDSSMREIVVIASLKEGSTSETVSLIQDSFYGSLNSNKWTAGDYYLYEDNMLRVRAQANPSEPTMMIFIIMERVVSQNPPTANEIAEDLEMNHPEYIDVVSGGSSCLYSGSGRGYSIINATLTDYNNIRTYLSGLGYSYEDYSDSSCEYTKLFGMLGDRIEIDLSYYSNYISVRYYFYTGDYTSYESFTSLLNSVCSFTEEVTESVVETVTLDENSEFYVVSSNGDYFGVVTNVGDEFIEEFTSLSTGYVSIFGGYKFEDYGNSLVKFEKGDGYVKFESNWYDNVDFGSYEIFNDYIDEYLDDHSLDSSLAVKFSDSDNLGDGFCYSYFYGTSTEVNEAKAIFEQHIKDNGNFTYSSYLDCYINVDTGFAYTLTTGIDHNAYYLFVKLETNKEFEDFYSYNELNLDEVALLSEFPAFISNEEKDDKLFVNPSFEENYIGCYVSKDSSTLMNYPNVLINNGFTASDGSTFIKYSNNYIYRFDFSSVYDNDRVLDITFQRIGPFVNHNDFMSLLSQEVAESLDNFYFEDNFVSSSPAYFLLDDFENYFTFYVSNREEVSDYEAYLLDNGFRLTSEYTNGREYLNSNANNTEFYEVTVRDEGSFYFIRFEKNTISFVSWNQLVNDLSNNNFDYESISAYLPFPDDGEGDIYRLNYASTEHTEIHINLSYDINSYISAMLGSENFISSSHGRYLFKYGYIEIYYGYYYIQVIIHYQYYEDFDGSTFDDALTASLGTNDIVFHNRNTYFEFTPEESGNYVIYSSSTVDTYGYLYDGNHIEITSDDDGQGNMQFKIERYLTAGTTYYIGARLYDESTSETYEGTLNIELVTD